MDEQKQEEQPAEAPTRLSPPEEHHQAEHERVREPSQYQTAMLMADQFGETDEGPRKQLVRPVQEGKKLSRSVNRPPGAEVQPRTEQTKQVLSLSPAFNWEDRKAVIVEIAAEKGTATTVKMTLGGTTGGCLNHRGFPEVDAKTDAISVTAKARRRT